VHIVAIHQISDSEKFWSAVQQAPIPEGTTLHLSLPNQDGTRAVCHWESDSVNTVKSLVDDTVGAYSTNEFYEVQTDNALGL
jgi:hypothetical protein